MPSVLYFDDMPDHPDRSWLFMGQSGNFPITTITRIHVITIAQYRPWEYILSRIYSSFENLSGALNPMGVWGKSGRIDRNGA
jgi:hypothetical protein